MQVENTCEGLLGHEPDGGDGEDEGGEADDAVDDVEDDPARVLGPAPEEGHEGLDKGQEGGEAR